MGGRAESQKVLIFKRYENLFLRQRSSWYGKVVCYSFVYMPLMHVNYMTLIWLWLCVYFGRWASQITQNAINVNGVHHSTRKKKWKINSFLWAEENNLMWFSIFLDCIRPELEYLLLYNNQITEKWSFYVNCYIYLFKWIPIYHVANRLLHRLRSYFFTFEPDGVSFFQTFLCVKT